MVRTISMVARQSWSFLYDNGDPRDYGDDFKTTHTTFTTHYNLWPQWVTETTLFVFFLLNCQMKWNITWRLSTLLMLSVVAWAVTDL